MMKHSDHISTSLHIPFLILGPNKEVDGAAHSDSQGKVIGTPASLTCLSALRCTTRLLSWQHVIAEPAANARSPKRVLRPSHTPISGVQRPIPIGQDRKLLDQFARKCARLSYALATEQAYRHWIVEFLLLYCDGSEWRRQATLVTGTLSCRNRHC